MIWKHNTAQGAITMSSDLHRHLQPFIRKWAPVLAAPWTCAAENPDFGDDCFTLGFEMDCMTSLQEKFPGEDVSRASFLRRVIHTIHDVHFLGTAIFSYWRYLTHWHEAPPPEDAAEWFSTAFSRLSELADSGKGTDKDAASPPIQNQESENSSPGICDGMQ